MNHHHDPVEVCHHHLVRWITITTKKYIITIKSNQITTTIKYKCITNIIHLNSYIKVCHHHSITSPPEASRSASAQPSPVKSPQPLGRSASPLSSSMTSPLQSICLQLPDKLLQHQNTATVLTCDISPSLGHMEPQRYTSLLYNLLYTVVAVLALAVILMYSCCVRFIDVYVCLEAGRSISCNPFLSQLTNIVYPCSSLLIFLLQVTTSAVSSS